MRAVIVCAIVLAFVATLSFAADPQSTRCACNDKDNNKFTATYEQMARAFNLTQMGCSILDGIKCAEVIAECVTQCHSVQPCIACIGSSWGQCCPCINKILHESWSCN